MLVAKVAQFAVIAVPAAPPSFTAIPFAKLLPCTAIVRAPVDTCGSCFGEIDAKKAEMANFPRGLHDACGSTRIKGVTWDTGKAPDNAHPRFTQSQPCVRCDEAGSAGEQDQRCCHRSMNCA